MGVGEKSPVFVYKEQYLHTHFKGKPFLQTNVCVIPESPFKKTTDMGVLIFKTLGIVYIISYYIIFVLTGSFNLPSLASNVRPY